jgi:hypothetical protein
LFRLTFIFHIVVFLFIFVLFMHFLCRANAAGSSACAPLQPANYLLLLKNNFETSRQNIEYCHTLDSLTEC